MSIYFYFIFIFYNKINFKRLLNSCSLEMFVKNTAVTLLDLILYQNYNDNFETWKNMWFE